jgi:hypothetical protein
MFQIKLAENVKNTRFKFNNFFPENHTVFEVMSKNTVQQWRSHKVK